MQHTSPELGQEDFGVCKLGSPSTNSPPMPSLGMAFLFSPYYMLTDTKFPDMEAYSTWFVIYGSNDIFWP